MRRVIQPGDTCLQDTGECARENIMEEIHNFDVTRARFSLFGAGITKKTGQKPYMQGTLLDVYAWMNTPRMAELTRQLRAIEDEEQQKDFKATMLPFVTFSGQFNYRKTDGLIEHSSLQCFDFDHLNGLDEVRLVKKMLLTDEYFDTEFMFTSPRGNGVKWVTHIDLSRGTHEQWYAAIREHLRRTYGLNADLLPSNVASPCFLAFDAEMIINPKIAKF